MSRGTWIYIFRRKRSHCTQTASLRVRPWVGHLREFLPQGGYRVVLSGRKKTAGRMACFFWQDLVRPPCVQRVHLYSGYPKILHAVSSPLSVWLKLHLRAYMSAFNGFVLSLMCSSVPASGCANVCECIYVYDTSVREK